MVEGCLKGLENVRHELKVKGRRKGKACLGKTKEKQRYLNSGFTRV